MKEVNFKSTCHKCGVTVGPSNTPLVYYFICGPCQPLLPDGFEGELYFGDDGLRIYAKNKQ